MLKRAMNMPLGRGGAAQVAPATAPSAKDWALLVGLVFCGGSSFAAIKVAVVDAAPPAVIAAGRLWIAAALLYAYMKATGRALPPVFARNDGGAVAGVAPAWISAALIGAIGYAAPMMLFPIAQETVSSLLAGIYMAFMPLVTVLLAALFAGEPLTRGKMVGFAAGTLGVIVLIGPAAISNILSTDVGAQLLLLLASTCYAVAAIILRRAPDVPARSFAVMFMVTGAVMVTPLAVIDLLTMETEISSAGWSSIIYLGLVPTGITAIFIINLIRGPGAGFTAMGNYLTPAVAILYGIVLFGELLAQRYIWGLLIILVGVAMAQPPAALKQLFSRGGTPQK